ALFSGLQIFGKGSEITAIFADGALFLGTFVGYLGLLIASSRWYHGKKVNYVLFQAITIVAGIAALAIGSIFGIGELHKIGGTFFVLYIIEKLIEIPVEGLRAKAFIGLIISALVFAFCMHVKANPSLYETYLFSTFQ